MKSLVKCSENYYVSLYVLFLYTYYIQYTPNKIMVEKFQYDVNDNTKNTLNEL